jgi:hypothetical protein
MRSIFACLLAMSSVSALAGVASAGEATTYAGTLGKSAIIVELQAAGKDGSFVGRYAYLKKGVDIPLHGKARRHDLTIGEEAPCTVALCMKNDQVIEAPPIGAQWTLTVKGKTLTGNWKDAKSGKSLPVALEEKARREIADEGEGMDLLDPTFSAPMERIPAFVAFDDLPYDFLKMGQPLKQGPEQAMDGFGYRMDSDPRSGLDYPVLTNLGDTDPRPVNGWLAQQRLQWSLPAFSCRSKAYLGSGWFQNSDGQSNGFDDGGATVGIDYLSTRLIVVSEGGSYFCGGAHPDNFITHRLANVRTGQPVVAERLLRGWVAKDADGAVVDPATAADPADLTWGPDDELVAYVRGHRKKRDADMEKDCGIDALVATNLGVYFKGNALIFTLSELPNVFFACGDDLVAVPIKDARPLLTEAGAKYFAEFDRP